MSGFFLLFVVEDRGAWESGTNRDVCVHRVFVNGRPRPVIFEDMRKRISRGDIAAERKEAIKVRGFGRPQRPIHQRTNTETSRQCVTLRLIERGSSNDYKAVANFRKQLSQRAILELSIY